MSENRQNGQNNRVAGRNGENDEVLRADAASTRPPRVQRAPSLRLSSSSSGNSSRFFWTLNMKMLNFLAIRGQSSTSSSRKVFVGYPLLNCQLVIQVITL